MTLFLEIVEEVPTSCYSASSEDTTKTTDSRSEPNEEAMSQEMDHGNAHDKYVCVPTQSESDDALFVTEYGTQKMSVVRTELFQSPFLFTAYHTFQKLTNFITY